MSKQPLKSESGLTFIEMLVTLMIFTMLSSLVIGYLVNSMNNFKRVNEEIALHDEANYVMSQLVNYIFVAKNVTKIYESNNGSLIEVTNFEGSKKIIGFACNKAVVGTDYEPHDLTSNPKLECKITDEEQIINLDKVTLLPVSNEFIIFNSSGANASKITVDHDKDTVFINMVLENNQPQYPKTLELDSEVSFVQVDTEK